MNEPEYKEDEVENSPELKVGNSDADQLTPSNMEAISNKASKAFIGKIVGGHYKIISLLGEGGMSTVYRAHHMLLDREVALKFVSTQLVDDSKTIRRLQREAQAAVALNHENVCAVKEFGLDENERPFIVMDYLEGLSLADSLKDRKSFEYRDALSLIRQVGSGLGHAHEKGVIHRDIKPSNIVLLKDDNSEPRVSIVDFGIAKLERDDVSGPNLTQTGEVFGTPNYMSPEQCNGDKVDHRSDIYSLGCVLYELLSGAPPFKGSMLNIMMQHMEKEPEKIDGIPGDVMYIINKCMAKNPEERYSSTHEIERDIDLVLQGKQLKRSRHALRGQKKSLWLQVLIVTIGVAVLSMTAFKNFWIATDRDLYMNTSKTGQFHTQAIKKHSRGKTEEALKLLRKAVKQAKEDNVSNRNKMELYRDLAGCSLAVDKPEKAIEAFGEAAKLAKQIGEANLYEKYLTNQAHCELSLGGERFNSQAIAHLKEALKSRQKRSGEGTWYTIPYWQELGKAYFAAGKMTEAESCFNKLITIETSTAGSDNPAKARANWYLGLINEQKGNLKEAQSYLKIAQKYARLSLFETSELNKLKEDILRVKKAAH